MFKKTTQDAREEKTETFLVLIPEKEGQVRVKHYNARHKTITPYIGEAIGPYVMKMDWAKYHDPIVNLL